MFNDVYNKPDPLPRKWVWLARLVDVLSEHTTINAHARMVRWQATRTGGVTAEGDHAGTVQEQRAREGTTTLTYTYIMRCLSEDS